MSDAAEKVVHWLEGLTGGRVVEIEPQARWRPVWFAHVEGATVEGAPADGRLSLCVRGDRIDTRFGFPIDHEMKFQQLLHAHGIPVARVYGWNDDLRAYAMDAVPGRADFIGAGDEERDAVMDHYMEILARIHQLPIEPFAEAGIMRAETPERAWRVGMDIYETAYRESKKRPDPFLEFCLGWLRRNPLEGPVRECVVVWDSGQLHHAGGRVQAVLDLELGHLGDPMMDLAGYRMRTSVLNFGDFDRHYAAYERFRGEPVDLKAIEYHHFCFTLSNQLAFHAALAEPPPGSDYMTNMQWCAETNIYAMEALGDMLGVELAAPPLPEARTTPAATGHAHLVQWLRHFEAPTEYQQHEARIAFRLARHLQRSAEIGPALEAADLDDIERLTGYRPAHWQEGDAVLERFVLDDRGEHDEALVHLFHARTHRYLMLLGPEGSAMARHNPIPRFR